MTWDELTKRHARRNRITHAEARKQVLDLMTDIMDHAIHGKRVPIPGIGVFLQQRRAKRHIKGFDGADLILPERLGVLFRASKTIVR